MVAITRGVGGAICNANNIMNKLIAVQKPIKRISLLQHNNIAIQFLQSAFNLQHYSAIIVVPSSLLSLSYLNPSIIKPRLYHDS